MDDRRRTKDDGRRAPSAGKSSHCLWQGELTTVIGYICRSTRTHYSDSEPTSPLLFLLNAAFLAEKQQIPILFSFVRQDCGSYPQSIALEASTLTITLPMRLPFICLIKISYCPSIYYLKTKINPKQ